MISVPPKIDFLPEHLIDQIKAGEVIERPGSLIKEILENTVDAGSKKIELIIRNNGLDLISLKDDGHGMRFDDLPLAFSRHATSKIKRFEDLYSLNSFGFRGEALASIASISRLQCISFTGAENDGSEIRIEGGHTILHERRKNPGQGHGTELVIQDMFFNTPARLKFIQSQQAEKQFIRRIIYAFILSHPEIEFQVKVDDEEKEIFQPCSDLKSRLNSLLPKARDQILHMQKFYENNELDLYLIPGQFKTPVKWQNVFINGRYVLDKQLHRVLSQALLANFGQDDFHYMAFFNLPGDSIDVNVHPNKTVIKCMESSKMISLLTSTVRELSIGRKKVEAVGFTPRAPESFLSSFDEDATLSQERHEYNLDGHFSPHNLPHRSHELFWIGQFLVQEQAGRWMAYSSAKLISSFIQEKIKAPAPAIPLLVSEPFPKKNINPKILASLNAGGFELEPLGPDTLVLRSIPEWMSGFPLKEIMQVLLKGDSLEKISINPADWASSSWQEMIEFLGTACLMEKNICVNLNDLLTDKLK